MLHDPAACAARMQAERTAEQVLLAVVVHKAAIGNVDEALLALRLASGALQGQGQGEGSQQGPGDHSGCKFGSGHGQGWWLGSLGPDCTRLAVCATEALVLENSPTDTT